jgi:amidase
VDPLCELSATELAALVASREVSSRDVVAAHLERIVEVNGYVNAVTVVLREPALAGAAAADGGRPRGPLHGVPFTVKENIDCIGSATTQGVPALRGALPWRDAPVVARMKAAGAIVVGRTNLSEFALRLDTDNPLHGRTRNPWNGSLTPGGSSGGEAAALATGMTPFGLGNDLGGSLRNPAYCCGVTALKPTAGRIPRASSLRPYDHGFAIQAMAVEGPMARSVADLRLGLSVLAGRDIRDPRSVDVPLEGPAIDAPRAALTTRIPGVELPSATVAAVRRAGQLLAAAGWEVESAEPPELDLVGDTWLDLLAGDLSELLPAIRSAITPPTYDYVSRLCRMGEARGRPNSEIHATRSFLQRLWSEFFVCYPLVVGPTWTCLPWPAGADLEPQTGLRLVLDTARFITPGNVLGLPSVALPMGLVDGLPTGVQIYADLWREDLCLQAAEIIEAGVGSLTPIEPVM